MAEAKDPKATPMTNIDLRTAKLDFDTSVINHINIEKNKDVHQMVMDQIRQTCPLRTAWARTHGGVVPVSQAPLPGPRIATP